MSITTDEAIEQRNRKHGKLCLFVPADVVDAAISSLGNSFAEIDGRDLYRDALKAERFRLANESPDTARLIAAVQATLRPNDRVSDGARLDFTMTAATLEADGELDRLGLELWRVNLIPDARPDFKEYLPSNRESVRTLARPTKLTDSARDRVAKLKVKDQTARALESFLAQRSLHDIPSWTRDLIEAELTFDTWVFPEGIISDLEAVRIKPFLDPQGTVLSTCKLIQPGGPGTPLLASVGPKAAISVGWVSEPLKPSNEIKWSVSVEATRPEEDGTATFLDLPTKEVKGTSRTARLAFDLDFDELPESSFRVRVVAIDESGNELQDSTRNTIEDSSSEFYFSNSGSDDRAPAQSRRTVPSLATGRLEAALSTKTGEVNLTEPMWAESKEASYFSLRADPRTTLSLGFSPVLLELEHRTLATPESGGRWHLDVDEVLPTTVDDIHPTGSILHSSSSWESFWSARSNFFSQVRSTKPRDVVEVIEWTRAQTEAALTYAKAYQTLLRTVSTDELPDALSIDTIHVRLNAGGSVESAIVVCPTHPLRALWFASHAALCRKWEEALLELKPAARSKQLDLRLLDNVTPMNMPAFAHAIGDNAIHLFFQNLGFAHGVALPPDVTDPLRRYNDLAHILDWSISSTSTDDRSHKRLADHLERFRDIHPYADPLQIALVNPDQGQFLALALDEVLAVPPVQGDDDEEPQPVPSLHVTGYELEDRFTSLGQINRVRTKHGERPTSHPADHLYPALSTTVRGISSLTDFLPEETPNAHFAVISDLSRPQIETRPKAEVDGRTTSLALHGLIARFVGEFSDDGTDVRWQHRIIAHPDQISEHPSRPEFGKRLSELYTSILDTTGRLAAPHATDDVQPVLVASLQDDQIKIFETLHANADWVVTVDRFVGVDYYDSPHIPAFKELAEKHLIDHSPEFIEGLGHRMIVTTAWRDEVATILRRAMEELGLSAVDRSVRKLLYYLKTISGRLALQALSPDSGGKEAVSLGVVMAWLRSQQRLERTLLVPVDVHQELFNPTTTRGQLIGQRRCDLVLVTLETGHIDLEFVEVKSRMSPLGSLDQLADDMALQMRMTSDAVEDRYFNPERVDATLQRASFANVLRFYADRARRYELLGSEGFRTISGHISRFE